MKPVAVKYHKSVIDKSSSTGYSRQENEGTLVAFGMDSGQESGSWSTGIIILFDGRFDNVPVENITIKEPFKSEEWI